MAMAMDEANPPAEILQAISRQPGAMSREPPRNAYASKPPATDSTAGALASNMPLPLEAASMQLPRAIKLHEASEST